MKKIKVNRENTKKRIEEIRLALNKIYVEQGNTETVVKMSQELDKYILIEQKKTLKSK